MPQSLLFILPILKRNNLILVILEFHNMINKLQLAKCCKTNKYYLY